MGKEREAEASERADVDVVGGRSPPKLPPAQ